MYYIVNTSKLDKEDGLISFQKDNGQTPTYRLSDAAKFEVPFKDGRLDISYQGTITVVPRNSEKTVHFYAKDIKVLPISKVDALKVSVWVDGEIFDAVPNVQEVRKELNIYPSSFITKRQNCPPRDQIERYIVDKRKVKKHFSFQEAISELKRELQMRERNYPLFLNRNKELNATTLLNQMNALKHAIKVLEKQVPKLFDE